MKKKALHVVLLTCLPFLLIGQNWSALDDYLQKHRSRLHLSGLTVTVTEGDAVVFRRGYGRLSPESPFYIGSLSKSFTAVAVLQLTEKGALQLDAPLSRLLPEVTVTGPESERLRVRHLLQHRSGLVRRQGAENPPPLDNLEASGFEVELNFPPDSAYAYSNLNYSLLGLVIERAAGQPYCAYLQENIFAPLGLESGACTRTGAEAAGVAPGHQYLFLPTIEVGPPQHAATATPAGFVVLSADGMTRYLTDLRADSSVLLSPESRAKLFTPGGEADTGYGMGWSVGKWNGQTVYQHAGATQQSFAYMAVFPEMDRTLFLMTNCNAYDGIANSITGLVRGAMAIANGEPADPVFPWSLVLRGAFGLLLLSGLFRFILSFRRWLGSRTAWSPPRQAGPWLRLIGLEIAAPIVLLFLLLRLVQTTLPMLLQVQPDIGWAIVGSIGLGIGRSVLQFVRPENGKLKAQS